MGKKDFGDTLSNAKAVALNNRSRTFRNTIGSDDQTDIFRIRLDGRSSLDAHLSYQGDRARMTLFQDQDGNGRLSRKEQLTKSLRIGADTDQLAASKLEPGLYFLNVKPTSSGKTEYTLSLNASQSSDRTRSLSTQGVRIPEKHWNASFLNRSRKDLRDYTSYDFSKADAVYDLGDRGKSGKTVAQLNIDYEMGSPDGVQSDYFAMEAWTRIRLKSGKFYRLTSTSDDGTRFLIKDRKTGDVLAEFNDNWSDRSTRDPEWSQIITTTKTGKYDFYVQYYENDGASTVDLELKKMKANGQVVPSALNVRSTASTLNNTPIDVLSTGETFKIRRQVQSSNDTVYRDWYKIVMDGGQKGFVVAGDNFVNIVGEASNVFTIGDGPFEPPTLPDDSNSGGGSSLQGMISSSVWITSDDKISIRSDKNISGTELGRVGAGTPLSLIEKVTGGSYLNGYDSWYRVRLNLNGRDQEGYVAAYYVDVLNDNGFYETGISKDNALYKPHLNEALNPTYYWTSYQPYIEQAAARYSWLKPSVIAGIGSRESGWGRLLSPPGPGGTGDGGHGRGLMQIDDRFHQTFISTGQWRNPKSNIDYGIDQVLSRSYAYLDQNTNLQGTDLLRGAIAAYNAGLGNVTKALSQGRDVDYYTTGQDYSWDVLNRAGWFQLNGWA